MHQPPTPRPSHQFLTNMRSVVHSSVPLREFTVGPHSPVVRPGGGRGAVVAVVAAHGPTHQLLGTLESLRNQTTPPDAIVVVTDGCRTATSTGGVGSGVVLVDAVGHNQCRFGALNLAVGELLAVLGDDDMVAIVDEHCAPHPGFLGAARNELASGAPHGMAAVVTPTPVTTDAATPLVAGCNGDTTGPPPLWTTGVFTVSALQDVVRDRSDGVVADRCGAAGVFDTAAVAPDFELLVTLRALRYNLQAGHLSPVAVFGMPRTLFGRLTSSFALARHRACGVIDATAWLVRTRFHRPAPVAPGFARVVTGAPVGDGLRHLWQMSATLALGVTVAVGAITGMLVPQSAATAGVIVAAGALRNLVGVWHGGWVRRLEAMLVAPWLVAVTTNVVGTAVGVVAGVAQLPAVLGRRKRRSVLDATRRAGATGPLTPVSAVNGMNVALHPVPGIKSVDRVVTIPFSSRVLGYVAATVVVLLVAVPVITAVVVAPRGAQWVTGVVAGCTWLVAGWRHRGRPSW